VRTKLLQTFALGIGFAIAACSSSSSDDSATGSGATGAGGGATAGLGNTAAAGHPGTGGTGVGAGGTIGGNTAGAGTGVAGTGFGTAGTGFGTGGTFSSGGTGFGTAGTGFGTAGTGFGMGGATGSAGAGTAGGGHAGTSAGGSTGAGGNVGHGGSGAGGSTGTAGSGAGGSGGSTVACNGPALSGGSQHCSSNSSGTANSFTWTIWSSGSGGCIITYGSSAAFSATWNNSGDFLARVGLSLGSNKTFDQLGTISADFSETFTVVPVEGKTSKIYVALYGWTVDPLSEFYIIDDYGDFVPGPINSDGSSRINYGSLTVDDGTYDIWAMPVKNRPAITGDNKDFTQIFNVRKERRKCGHISASQHFAKWSTIGLPVGKLEEAMFLMEAQNNSGTVNVTTATISVK